MEKLDDIPLSSINLVQVLKFWDLLFKSKTIEDWESYMVLTQEHQSVEELTPT